MEILKKIKSFLFYKIRNLIRRGTIDFPFIVEIETITTCNRRCSYCPNSVTERSLPKNEKLMSTKLYYKIINELAEVNYDGRISPHFYGEPLLDKRLVDLMRYTRKKLPRCEISIFTNGDPLSIKKYNSLKEAGVSKLVISQHGKEMSETLKKLFTYLKKSKNNQIKIEYKKNIEEKGLENRGGLVKPKILNKKSRCYLPSSAIVIDHAGNVILCCNDYHSSIKFGDLNKEKLFNIWNKPHYKKIRLDLIRGIFNLGMCKICVGKK